MHGGHELAQASLCIHRTAPKPGSRAEPEQRTHYRGKIAARMGELRCDKDGDDHPDQRQSVHQPRGLQQARGQKCKRDPVAHFKDKARCDIHLNERRLFAGSEEACTATPARGAAPAGDRPVHRNGSAARPDRNDFRFGFVHFR